MPGFLIVTQKLQQQQSRWQTTIYTKNTHLNICDNCDLFIRMF